MRVNKQLRIPFKLKGYSPLKPDTNSDSHFKYSSGDVLEQFKERLKIAVKHPEYRLLSAKNS
jgi:hypothetical protein